MGHGLQMWLQIIWFIVKSSNSNTIILDEPDVYLHADLQRKLYRILNKLNKQIIVATHSIEIISEVEPENILVIEKSKSSSHYAVNLPGIQSIIDNIGSTHNLQISKLWSAKKCIFIEGDDIKILKIFYDLMFPNEDVSIDSLPNMSTNGWGGWHYVIGSSTLLKNNFDQNITKYCIFDRDYHTEEDIKKRYEEAECHNVNLHIWQKKELENYLLEPQAILRLIKYSNPESTISINNIEDKLNYFAEEMKDDIFACISSEIQKSSKKLDLKTVIQKAKQFIDFCWQKKERRIDLVSGKEMLKKIREWLKSEYNISPSNERIAREIKLNELEPEVKTVLKAIKDNSEINF